ncbi:MAG: TetR/AcrR family transcriptional regulator [Xanthomonadales bacterium]|nr:TetR/AcrR family transcriptional regulator [Xanthomonadales bacterium]
MPYAPEHKIKTRQRIINSARSLFNQKGFNEVSIDEIMADAGLTRGGFYYHFRSKDALFTEAIETFKAPIEDKNSRYCIDQEKLNQREIAHALLDVYLSNMHLENVGLQCPMVALPSDISRSGPESREAYGSLMQRMSQVFKNAFTENSDEERQEMALVLSSLCVGGMVLARTIDNPHKSDAILDAAKKFGSRMIEGHFIDSE